MKNSSRAKAGSSIGRFILKLFTVLLFVAVAGVTLFFAYGYRFDVEGQSVEKTSIIDLANRASDVRVSVDAQLVSEFMPVQLKGILPGLHTLNITKKGFRPWARTLTVNEDIVTIVEDVLLVPEDVSSLIQEAVQFGPEDVIYPGDGYLLAFSPGSQVLSIVELFNSGSFKEEEIGFYRAGLVAVETMPGQRFLLHFDDGLSAYVSFSERVFKTFAPKTGARKIRVDADRRLVYFLADGSLYRMEFDAAGEIPLEDYSLFEFRKDVADYEIDESGNVYYITGGVLLGGAETGIPGWIARFPTILGAGDLTNLSIIQEGSHVALVVRSDSDKRYLFFLDENRELMLLAQKLKGSPFLTDHGDYLYADTDGNIFVYNGKKAETIPLTTIEGNFELLGWFADRSHFLVLEEGKLVLHDIFDANVTELLSEYPADRTFISGKILFFLKGGVLNSLSWIEE
ncbi:MAG TPA: hypothetical protein VI588_01685 [Candidatus Gracilibacteria bacterium]|nr:hypothetical protein [Candidatus Gracilibacteria bacterium]